MTHVRIEKPQPHTSVIVLDRAERMNAMSFDLVGPLYEALDEVGQDNDCFTVVLTGTGDGFCSGLDLEDAGVPPNIEGMTLPGIALRAMEYMSNLVPTLRGLRQPVIGAINGAAVGGGMCLSLGTDIRIASENAYFRGAGINNGLTGTELGVSFLLPRLVGASRAFEILLSGRDVNAAEALHMGLVSRVVPRAALMETALELAQQINGWSTQGVAMTKQVLWGNLEAGSLEQAMDLENRNQLLIRLTTSNLDEAIRARREKRKPVYED
jgi:enoyl-CoA hydratase